MKIKSQQGVTLVEVMLGMTILVTLFGSMVAAYVAVKSLNMMARHKMQAIQVVRGQIETLKARPFANIANATSTVAYDAGADHAYGTADDLTGTVTVAVQDALDMDNDNNTAESQINVDGSGGNDAVAAPVRVTFTWNEWVVGQRRTLSVRADTLIAQ